MRWEYIGLEQPNLNHCGKQFTIVNEHKAWSLFAFVPPS